MKIRNNRGELIGEITTIVNRPSFPTFYAPW